MQNCTAAESKLLSVVVPCNNAQDYMCRCVDSLLPGLRDVEILIVDDGSTDNTAAIADKYVQTHPGDIRVVHKPNGGHGDAIMAGLAQAHGFYFKVVDSDDWLDALAYPEALNALRSLRDRQSNVDLFICNYVYDKVGVAHKHAVGYSNALPVGKEFTWSDIGHFRLGQYIVMHSAIYRTGFLKACGISLPKHTFYVDNLYVYVPLSKVRSMYYLNVNLYHYFIGRADQSVNERVMIERIDQQLYVNQLLLKSVRLEDVTDTRKRAYLRNYLEIITGISSLLLIKSGTPECMEKHRQLWRFIRNTDAALYTNRRRRPIGFVLNLPGCAGRMVSVSLYTIIRRVYGFN